MVKQGAAKQGVRDKFPAVNMPTADERREALQKFGHLLR
jgi:hypothetical protein